MAKASGTPARGSDPRAPKRRIWLASVFALSVLLPTSAVATTARIARQPSVRTRTPTTAVSLQTLVDDYSFSARSRIDPRGPGPAYNPAPGEPVFTLSIPAIGSKEIVRQGTDQEQLALGPGHYPDCGTDFGPPYCAPFEEVWPGERGRVVVGGHRTMAGADFLRLDELDRGHRLIVEADWGTFTYVVTSTSIVDPMDRTVIVPDVPGREMALVTCHPRDSSAQRLIVFSRLLHATVEVSAIDREDRPLRILH